ncbi:PpaA, heme-binding protein SCHIC domain protein sensory protein, regulator for photosystem formation [Salipiger mucosus DSM 16094]|uniref:PpaA, heme-binding protein SCHIC domain protein sensory protein, regulator for photosystem formation n=2 Tax=Salipiger mucosus TaxID=263378 RepID=S9Q7H8_9RHOB|nr:PpaA, heme-binding protein SCHIC domain protein sensory protein, regulator for photosystem formation [Salipiger mucosus DSM 16094]
MNDHDGSGVQPERAPAIRFLVESALRKVNSSRAGQTPRHRGEWVELFVEALMSESETSHKSVLASLMANGIGSQELYDYYVPEASRRLGELWVKDRASFVDVTVGAARLQALFRNRPDGASGRFDRSIPLGESFLMIVPTFEDHSLGAFVAADQLRRHGVWVHMGIGMSPQELVDFIGARRFSALGISAATWNTLEKVTELVDYCRSKLDHVPPVVVGGRAVSHYAKVTERTGADFAVKTAREAVERCGLSTVATELDFDGPR